MAKPKKRGKQKIPPLSAADIIDVLMADDWFRVPAAKHLAFKHDTKRGKVIVDAKWEHIRVGDWVCRSVREAASLTHEEFEELYWATR